MEFITQAYQDYGWGLYAFVGIVAILFIYIIVLLTKKRKRVTEAEAEDVITSLPLQKTNLTVTRLGNKHNYTVKQKPGTSGTVRQHYDYFYDDDSLIEDLVMIGLLFYMYDNELYDYDTDIQEHIPELVAVSESAFSSSPMEEPVIEEPEVTREPVTEEPKGTEEVKIESEGETYVKEPVYAPETKFVDPMDDTRNSGHSSGDDSSYDSGSSDDGGGGGGDD